MAKLNAKIALDAVKEIGQSLIDQTKADAQQAGQVLEQYLASVEPSIETCVEQAVIASDPSTWYDTIDALIDVGALRAAEQLESVQQQFADNVRVAAIAAVHTLIAAAIAVA